MMSSNPELESSGTDLVGTWILTDARLLDAQGRSVARPYGDHPAGCIIYTAEHRMMAIITKGDLKPLDGDRFTAPESQRAAAFSASSAYSGRYEFDGRRVVHFVEVATIPNWVGATQVRDVKIEGATAIYRFSRAGPDGTLVTEIRWKRIPPANSRE